MIPWIPDPPPFGNSIDCCLEHRGTCSRGDPKDHRGTVQSSVAGISSGPLRFGMMFCWEFSGDGMRVFLYIYMIIYIHIFVF